METCLTIGLGHYLALAAMLFVIGLLGVVLNRRNMIVMLMAIELMLLAVNINLVAFARFGGAIAGEVFTMMILTVAAAESAIGLAIFVIAFRQRGSLGTQEISELKG